jgi:glycosyltransferase involved in cell wall biosynthesis
MRILNVTASYAPFLEFGGPPVKVRSLSEGLARLGHSVTVLTADWGIDERLRDANGQVAAERSPFGWRREENGVQAIYLPTWLRRRALSWNPAAKRYCRARLQNFDVAHIFGLYDLLGPAVAGECRAKGLPYVVEPIGMFLPIVRNILLKRMYHAVLGRRLLWGASAVIATSEQEVEELASGGVRREKIVLRRNGVERPKVWPKSGAFRKEHKIGAEAKVVLFLGRLSVKKSPELLLKAVADLPTQLQERELKLVYAGPDEGGVRKQLAQMASRLGMEKWVYFSGPIYGDAKWAAYRDADVFVLPSQNENFGNSAAEAVAAGTPVIVTEHCGIAPLLADQAGLVVAHEASSISGALARVLSEPGLRERLAAGCPGVAARLGWEEPVQEMESLYARIAARRDAESDSKTNVKLGAGD